MKISRRWMLQLAAAAVTERPITIVVPFAAGGPLDAMARIMADRKRSSLGLGAAGSIGVGRVARAAPDGYIKAGIKAD
jgi:tripartite-type tricarboxylate transporter receptor subunit TctC